MTDTAAGDLSKYIRVDDMEKLSAVTFGGHFFVILYTKPFHTIAQQLKKEDAP